MTYGWSPPPPEPSDIIHCQRLKFPTEESALRWREQEAKIDPAIADMPVFACPHCHGYHCAYPWGPLPPRSSA
jgi:hypothetical protein